MLKVDAEWLIATKADLTWAFGILHLASTGMKKKHLFGIF